MISKNIFISLLLCIIFCCEISVAQQIPQFAHGSLNPEFYNPAVTGITKSINVSAIGRSQWVSLTGHPTAQSLCLSSFVPRIHGGIGAIILNNQQGVQRNTYATIGYSFIAEKNNHRFGFGIRGGIIQSLIEGDKLRAPDGYYSGGTLNHNDGLLPINSVSSMSPELSAGVFYMNKIMNFGISGSHFLSSSLEYSAYSGKLSIDEVKNITANILFIVNNNKSIKIKPSVIIKYNFNELQTEASILFGFKKFGWIGSGYRGLNSNQPEAIIGFLAFNLSSNFEVGYAYEYSISKLSSANDGSHELIMRYLLSLTKPAKPEKIIFTPRF